MTYPLTRGEISQILMIDENQVGELWDSGKLKRSIENERRPLSYFRLSDTFDLVEYMLSNGNLPIRVSEKESSYWIDSISEALDLYELKDACISKIVEEISLNAMCIGICDNEELSSKIAWTCMTALIKVESLSAAYNEAA